MEANATTAEVITVDVMKAKATTSVARVAKVLTRSNSCGRDSFRSDSSGSIGSGSNNSKFDNS